MISCGNALAREQERELRARRQRVLQHPGVVEAVYTGVCPICGERFRAQEPVKRTEDGWVPVLDHPEVLDG